MSKRENLLKLKSNQNFRNYLIISNDSTEDGLAKPLGEGGSGIVYLAEQSFVDTIKVKRAVKFFVFRDDIAEKFDTSSKISIQNF